MSTIAIMVLFGLSVPIFNYISNAMRGMFTKEMTEMRQSFTKEHLALVSFGTIIGCIPAIAYWVYVISQL